MQSVGNGAPIFVPFKVQTISRRGPPFLSSDAVTPPRAQIPVPSTHTLTYIIPKPLTEAAEIVLSNVRAHAVSESGVMLTSCYSPPRTGATEGASAGGRPSGV